MGTEVGSPVAALPCGGECHSHFAEGDSEAWSEDGRTPAKLQSPRSLLSPPDLGCRTSAYYPGREPGEPGSPVLGDQQDLRAADPGGWAEVPWQPPHRACTEVITAEQEQERTESLTFPENCAVL